MVKKKKVIAECSICDTRITYELSTDLANDKPSYPFEYLDIHGSPEHVLMLFLDKNLNLRDSIAYKDINFAKKKQSQFQKMTRLNEIESFSHIYLDPIISKIFALLIDGPKNESLLVEVLKNEPEFREDEMHLYLFPLIKNNLVKTAYLPGTADEYIFLTNDFTVIRTQPKESLQAVAKHRTLSQFFKPYLRKVKIGLAEYGVFFTNKSFKIDDLKKGLKYFTEKPLYDMYQTLKQGPVAGKNLADKNKKELMEEFLKDGIVMEFVIKDEFNREDKVMDFKIKDETYYFLLYEYRVVKFFPEYLLDELKSKLEAKVISRELVVKHLDLLATTTHPNL